MTDNATHNQRLHPRIEVQVEVELSFLEEGSRSVITRNFSKGGLYMQLDNPEHYPMGEMVHLQFNDPLNNDERTDKDGIIVRRADDGIAVAFVDMGDF
jgi:hypothetical protein